MAMLLNALVVFIQIALLAFIAWGGWLVLRGRFPGGKTADQAAAAKPAPVAGEGFERVASLVLLALLCTTIAAI